MTSRTAARAPGPRTYARRFAVALGVALGLHALAFALIPSSKPARGPREHVVTQTIALVRRTPPPTPRPTPRHTPAPSPQPTTTATPPHPTLAPRLVVHNPAPRAAAHPRRRRGGAAAHRRVAIAPPRLQAPLRSLAEGSHAGLQNGGTGTGAGTGNGSGGLGGNGTGTGGIGAGTGGPANTGPCGDVYLLPATVAYRRDGTVVQNVIAKVVLGNGDVELGAFPYPFVYPAEKDNPFTHEETDQAIPLQMPPPDVDLGAAPPAVRFALKYTNPTNGHTTLPQCAATTTPAG